MAVINFGSINIDHVYRVPHFVQPGETLSSSAYQQVLGGKGANQSIALGRAEAAVQHVGFIHHSDTGFRDEMAAAGVDCQHVQTSDQASGHAIIQVSDSGENAIVLFAGANHALTQADIDAVLAQGQAGDWVLTQNETSGVAQIISSAKAKGYKVAFNPAPMAEDVKQLPLADVDLLIVNEVEAAELTGKVALDDILQYFKTEFPKSDVIVTLGKEGVKMLREQGDLSANAFVVDAVDTTAAGDTFIGYFMAAFSNSDMSNDAAQQALVRGCGASALAVTRSGAAPSIPTSAEVDAFLAKQ